MAIDFSRKRWEELKQTYRRWWAGDLGRPILGVTISGRDPGRPEPKLPAYGFTARYGLSLPAEAIVDRWDYDLSCCEFLGDAGPMVRVNFGAGIVAGFLGARVEADERTVWFHPDVDREIADLHFAYDPDNVWLRRVKEICRAAVQRWQGLVQIGMTDLGGNLDVLASFRPGQKLLLDLYDHPDQVQRCLWEIHELWHRYYAEVDEVLQAVNPGYTAWAGIFSPEPHYMLQCDFAYMISPEMFERFVRPELVATCKRLPNTFYHQDGVGQLPHTDLLLSIEELDGIQWVPGAGQPQGTHWIDHYCRIVEAGKKVQLYDLDTVDMLAKRSGRAGQLFHLWGTAPDKQEQARQTLRRYGVI